MSLGTTISIDQALDVWSEFVDAYYGKNSYGGDTAEIYIYRLMPRTPGGPDDDDYLRANQALSSLLLRFQSRYADALISLYATRKDDGRRFGTWVHKCQESHRHHIRIGRVVEDDPDYREGHDYVVCTECRSHVLIDEDRRSTWFEDSDADENDVIIGFTCDWDPCLADFSAVVCRPERELPEGLIVALGPKSEHVWPQCCQGGDQVAPLCTGCPGSWEEQY